MRLKFISAIIGLTALITSPAAMAHAFLDHAAPKVGAEVDHPPSEVKVWFSESVEPAFSKLSVFNAAGDEVDKKDTHRDKKEHNLLIVSLDKLPPGEFKVVWSVVSTDTHRTHGDFKFHVKSGD